MLEASCARERSRGPCPAPLSLPRDPPSCCRGVQLEVEVASGAALVNCSRTIPALLECGDLSPLWPGRQNESGDESPHSISDSLFVLLLRASRGSLTPTSNYTLRSESTLTFNCIHTLTISFERIQKVLDKAIASGSIIEHVQMTSREGRRTKELTVSTNGGCGF